MVDTTPLDTYLIVTTTDIPPYRYCTEDWTGYGGERGNRIYTVVAFVVLFTIPIVVICVSYAIIMRKLWQPEHVLTDQQAHGNKRKTTYMLLTVIVVFLICMLPFQIMVRVAPFVHADVLRSDAFFISTKISSVLAVCSMARCEDNSQQGITQSSIVLLSPTVLRK